MKKSISVCQQQRLLDQVSPREILRAAMSINGKKGKGAAKRRPRRHYKAMAAKRWEK